MAADQRLVDAVWGQEVTVTVGDLFATGWVSVRPEVDSFGCNSEWQIVIRCTDPRKYSTTQQSLTLQQSGSATSGLHWGVLHWSVLHWGSGAASSLQGVAVNAGSALSYPTIVITGPVTNPSLTNATTGVTLRFITTLVAGEVLTIDTAQNRVLLGATPWAQTLDPINGLPSDFGLVKGANAVSYQADALGDGTTAVLTWRDARS